MKKSGLNSKSKVIACFSLCLLISSCSSKKTLNEDEAQESFPYTITDNTKNRQLSAAAKRSFYHYSDIHPSGNELYTQFKYTPLKGLDYHGGDGTISRRDPSKVIFENGKYYVWYTYRHTPVPPRGADQSNDTIPSTDWDLSEIWYATSEDGFIWEEQGVAIPRPPKPHAGWRSVSTADILKWKGKYYLYYQGFLEASGKRGDYCPVAASYADSPDGPWTATNEIIVPNGAKGSWDQYAIHDPYPLVHNGKIYLYYKSAFNRPAPVWVGAGLAIADNPLGPFEKHPLNPVTTSGHETTLFPFDKGVAAMITKDGTEHFTIQYAEDWVNFEIASIVELMPAAAGPFVPDAFTDTKDGRGITWGLSHFVNASTDPKKRYSILARFDCDLSKDVDDPAMKKTGIWLRPDVYFSQGLHQKQRQRILEENEKLRND
ncbi:glycoside hydrolase [Fulvivirgaceae bacterium BMA12]|uniref:Glycoside hydrolase n=1 Tax=Agaribacillus aureus TaxID=3051825 RepID=A0ABT8LG69_9BACT|nr:glycoside hydrolase [Fulvivirgaceae bacterium BMA12]